MRRAWAQRFRRDTRYQRIEAWMGDNEIRGGHPGGAMVLFVDGRATFLAESIEKKLLGKWITRNGQEVAQQP